MKRICLIIAMVFGLALVSCVSGSTKQTLNERLVDALKSEKKYIKNASVLSVTEYKGKNIALFFYKIGALEYQEVRLFEGEGENLKLTVGSGGNPISPGADMFTLATVGPFLADGQNFGILYGQLLSNKVAAIEVIFQNKERVYHEINNDKGFVLAHEEGEFWGIKKIKAFDSNLNLIYTFPPE